MPGIVAADSLSFQQFDKLFRASRGAFREERKWAKNTLTPQYLRQLQKHGDPMGILLGTNADGTPFTPEDIKRFDDARQRLSKEARYQEKGIRRAQLIASANPADVERANQQIRSALLYKSNDHGELTFSVSAGPDSKVTHHQVRLRLEGWQHEIMSTRSFPRGVDRAVDGLVSVDCDCERYQYWFRYVATVGNFALSPYEHSFPKIRNPNLRGTACKHILKALGTVASPTVKRSLAEIMKRQAAKVGGGVGRNSQFLTHAQQDELARARPSQIDQAAVQKAFSTYQEAEKTFAKKAAKLPTRSARTKLKAREKALDKREAAIRATEQALAQVKQQQAKERHAHGLRAMIDAAEAFGGTREAAVSRYAERNNMNVDTVEQIAKEYDL